MRITTEVNDDSMFNRFNTLIDEIEELKLMIEKNKKISESKNWNNEKKIVSINTEIKKLERAVLVVSTHLQDVENTVSSNSVRIGILEEKHYNLVLSVKGVEKKILKRINELGEWIEGDLVSQSTPVKSPMNPEKSTKSD